MWFLSALLFAAQGTSALIHQSKADALYNALYENTHCELIVDKVVRGGNGGKGETVMAWV